MKQKILILAAFLQASMFLPMQVSAEEETLPETTIAETTETAVETETSDTTETSEDPTEPETSDTTEETITPTETETSETTEETTEEVIEPTEPSPEQLAEEFVKRIYTLMLGREADSGGLNNWTHRLLNGERTAADVIHGFSTSQEYRNKNASDAEYFTMLCQVMLDREPEAEELAAWCADTSLFSRAYYIQLFAQKTEFSEICAQYAVDPGTLTSLENRDKNEGLTRYFAMLSQECTGRIPDADTLNSLTGTVLNKDCSLNQCIWEYVSAAPSLERDASYVSALYSGVMGIHPDAGMLSDWTARMETGTTRFHVFLSMMKSEEFRRLCESFGISAYTEDISDIASVMKANVKALVYCSPSTSASNLGYVYGGQILTVTGFDQNWVRVDFMKSTGYLRRDQVAPYEGDGIRVLPVVNIPQCSTIDGTSLPTGCEVTSLAVLMHHLGFTDATKNLLAYNYMPRGAIGSTDPNYAFMGDPATSWSYGAYAGPIIKTAQNYFSAKGISDYTVNNLTGAGMEELYAQVDAGNPVLVWYTMNCTATRSYGATWTLHRGTATTEPGSGTYNFTWKKSEHCSVLVGYNRNKGTVILADVWANSGAVTGALTEYTVSAFESAYNWIGKQAVTITKKAAPSYDLTLEEYLFPVKWYIEQTNHIMQQDDVLYMEDWQSVPANALIVVTDGTTPVLGDGITACEPWSSGAFTGIDVSDPENTYILYTDAAGADLEFLARRYALTNDFVEQIELCQMQTYRPVTWEGTLNVFTPDDVTALDAAAFPELSELFGAFAMGETEYGVRCWHFTAGEGALSDLTDAERYAYLKDLENALNTNYPETIFLANVNFALTEDAPAVMSCTASSAWEYCGDFDGNGVLDSNDAAAILIHAAQQGVQGTGELTAVQRASGDLNCDGMVDASDAAFVLIHAAESGAGAEVSWLEILR